VRDFSLVIKQLEKSKDEHHNQIIFNLNNNHKSKEVVERMIQILKRVI